jgi:hypothetical protein
VNPTLEILLSPLYDGDLASEHRADLGRSGLTGSTIRLQAIRSVPPDLIDRLLGFPTPAEISAYLLPFPDPRGGWFDHIRMKVFPSFTTKQGTIKYLQPKRSGVRLYFPLATLPAALHSADPLYLIEGEKKSLSVAQLGCPAIGFCGVEGWHVGGSQELLPDFDLIPLRDRTVELMPDGDVQTNRAVARGVEAFAVALARRGARPRLVVLPREVAA